MIEIKIPMVQSNKTKMLHKKCLYARKIHITETYRSQYHSIPMKLTTVEGIRTGQVGKLLDIQVNAFMIY